MQSVAHADSVLNASCSFQWTYTIRGLHLNGTLECHNKEDRTVLDRADYRIFHFTSIAREIYQLLAKQLRYPATHMAYAFFSMVKNVNACSCLQAMGNDR